jgi:hypothetical protein
VTPLAEALHGRVAAHFEQAPELCGLVLLRVAVARMNAFDFEGARGPAAERALHPFATQIRGRLSSTEGQVWAFLGEFAAAESAFHRAHDAFATLSDPVLRDRELEQTGIYRAIAAMDHPARGDRDVRALVEPLVAPAGARLGTDANPCWKYLHHVYLRWLAHRPADTVAERRAYLALQGSWAQGEDHPWPLIGGYRSILLQLEGTTELGYLTSGSAAAAAGGPTLQVIGLALEAVVASISRSPRVVKVHDVVRDLPLAAPLARELAADCAAPAGDPMVPLRRLPFNYR